MIIAPWAIKMGLTALVPKVIETAWDYMFGDDPKPVPVINGRKEADRTKITDKQKFDIIHWHTEWKEGNLIHWHTEWKEGNLPNVRTRAALVVFVNNELDLNKSLSVYAKIWTNKL